MIINVVIKYINNETIRDQKPISEIMMNDETLQHDRRVAGSIPPGE